MKLVTITSADYWKWTLILLESFKKNANVNWDILILSHEVLDDSIAKRLKEYGDIELLRDYGEIHVEKNENLTKHTRYRRLLKNLQNPVKFCVPDRCLYLDSDMIVVGDLSELEEIDADVCGCFYGKKKGMIRYGIKMFNGGAVLYNGSSDLFLNIKEYFETFTEKNPLGEQYVLNKFFIDNQIEVYPLDKKWNRRWGEISMDEDIRIYHFAGEEKPDMSQMTKHGEYPQIWRELHNSLFPDEKINKVDLPATTLSQSQIKREQDFIVQKIRGTKRQKQIRRFKRQYGTEFVEKIRGSK